jgi:hypothetical protein
MNVTLYKKKGKTGGLLGWKKIKLLACYPRTCKGNVRVTLLIEADGELTTLDSTDLEDSLEDYSLKRPSGR